MCCTNIYHYILLNIFAIEYPTQEESQTEYREEYKEFMDKSNEQWINNTLYNPMYMKR